MFDSIIKNQILMTSLISALWIIPGLAFTLATNRKFKKRQKTRQINKISKLYPQ